MAAEPNILIPAITAVVSIATAIISGFVAIQIAKINSNVLRVEKATNSHTDLLVEATRLAAHAAGKEEQRIQTSEIRAKATEVEEARSMAHAAGKEEERGESRNRHAAEEEKSAAHEAGKQEGRDEQSKRTALGPLGILVPLVEAIAGLNGILAILSLVWVGLKVLGH